MPRHFLTTEDWSQTEIQALLDDAAAMKQARLDSRLRGNDGVAPPMRGKSIALVFFNPSLRTRTSFEIGAWQMGGHAVVLEPGKGAWPIAFDEVGAGVPMLGEEEEHVKEAARVLSRYCDLIGVRAFPKFVDWKVDREDRVIKSFAKYATVPVINMETIVHPCQELALALAMQERLGTNLRGKRFLLSWTYHPRPLNTAVANSALLIATKLGMDVTLLCPTPEYVLDERFMKAGRRHAAESGGSVTISHDIESAYRGADVVYAKSWGALPYFGRWEPEKPIRDAHRHFIVDEKKMALTPNAYFSHCLPMRRNVKATDAVVDSPRSMIIDEAENRLHVQKAVMSALVSEQP
jgi:N-acetylornithine carbamoyltransferase